MFKISFKENFKKVKTFNDRVTIVTLKGEIQIPKWFNIPRCIEEWVYAHPTVDFGRLYFNRSIETSGISICAVGDTFDVKIGERIAESRAKIRLYKFMQALIHKLIVYYTKILTGNEYVEIRGGHSNDSLSCAWRKYTKLLDHERHHLNELLQKTV